MKTKQKSKKSLAQKVKEKIDFLRSPDAAGAVSGISTESIKNLERLLENYTTGTERLNALKNELKMSQANAAIAKDELRAQFKHTKRMLKQQSDAGKKKSKKDK